MIKKIFLLIITIFSLSTIANAHVSPGSGSGLQLLSYKMTGPAPTIDNNLITTSDEWAEAYARKIIFTNVTSATVIGYTEAYLYLMNDDTTLYVGITFDYGTTGNNNELFLYFEEGSGGGNHNDQLDTDAESSYSSTKGGTTNDLYWDGSDWVQDLIDNENFQFELDAEGGYLNGEAAIPLNSLVAEDLRCDSDDEIGFFIKFWGQQRGGEDFYPLISNMNETNANIAPGWFDLQLGVDRIFTRLYSTYAANGAPGIDGEIDSDDAWRGAYQKNINLYDFKGGIIPATFYSINTANTLYVAMKIEDTTDDDASDVLLLYQEQDDAVTPADMPNYVLNNGRENCVGIDGNGGLRDKYHNVGTWVDDGGTSYPAAVKRTNNSYWFEFAIEKDNGNNIDLRVSEKALMQFLICYSNAGTPYYWEFSANSDALLVRDISGGNEYLSAGWPSLQMGVPYVQFVFPENNDKVDGQYPVIVYSIGPSGPAEVQSAEFQLIGDASFQSMTRVGDTGFWTATWDTTTEINGTYQLYVKVTATNGLVIDNLTSVEIANITGGAPSNPTCEITYPTNGQKISGTNIIQFTSTPVGIKTIESNMISIDGGPYIRTSAIDSHTWDTTSLSMNSAHLIRIKTIDNTGETGYTEYRLVFVDNVPSVNITSPNAGILTNGTIDILFTATPIAPATISSREISIDGGAWQPTTTTTSHNVVTTGLANGAHTFQIRATDSSGSVGLSPILLLNINNDPSISFTTNTLALAGQTINGTNRLDFQTNAYTPNTVKEISINGGAWAATSSPTSHFINTTLMVNGTYNFKLRITDDDGRIGYSQTLSFSIDNDPNIDFTPTTLTLASKVTNGEINFKFSASSNAPALLTNYAFSIDGGTWDKISGSTTNTNYDTTQLDDGTHSFQVRVIDNGGRLDTSQVLSFIIKNSPSATITSPTNGITVNSWVDIKFISEPVSPASIVSQQLSIDGGPWLPINTSTSNTNLDSTALNDGTHSFQIRVVDNRGKEGLSQILSVILKNGPGVAFTSPAPTTIVNRTNVLTFTATPVPPAAVTNVYLSIDGGPWIATTSISNNILDTTTLSDGVHDLTLRAIDDRGKTGETETPLSITVDNTGPVISAVQVIYPPNQTAVKSNDSLTITASIIDTPSGLDVSTANLDSTPINNINNQTMVDDGSSGDAIPADNIFSFQITSLNTLTAVTTFTISASDNLGNSTTVVGTAVMDNTPPTTNIIITNTDDGLFRDGDKITLRVTLNETQAHLEVDFSPVDSSYTPGAENVTDNNDNTYAVTYTISADNTRPDAQFITNTIYARDRAGNGPVSNIYILELDNTKPIFTNIDAQSNTYMNDETIIIKVILDETNHTVTGDFSMIDSQYLPGAETVSYSNGTNYITYQISTLNTTPDGNYSIIITVKDTAGNESHQSTSVELDNTMDPTTILAPTTGYFGNETILIEATAPDDTSKVTFELSDDGGANWYDLTGTKDAATDDTDGSDGWKLSWDTTKDNLGDSTNYQIRVISYDEHGRYLTEDIQSGITVDTTAPDLAVFVAPLPEKPGPLTGEVYIEEVQITGNYSDTNGISFIKSLYLEIKNSKGDHIDDSPVSIPASKDKKFSQVVNLIEGINVISIKIEDLAKNINVTTFTLTYIPPRVTETICKEGGKIVAANDTSLEIPANALLNCETITINILRNADLPESSDENIKLTEIAYEMIPENIIFYKMATITIPYTDAELDEDKDGDPDYEADKLNIFFLDGQDWVKAGIVTVDEQNKLVSVKVNHLGIYRLGIDDRDIESEVKGYWSKNPFKPEEGTTMAFTIPEAGTISLKVYDLTGDLVRTVVEEQNFDQPGWISIRWDGMDDFGQYIGSGLYFYILEFNGTPTIKKMLGVIK